MSSSFTPLFGVDSTSPHCYLLRVGEYNLLLDCGWNEEFDLNVLVALEPYLLKQEIDAILVSHSSLLHLGALPWITRLYHNHAHLNCPPIYATLPVQRMGELTLYDVHQQYSCISGSTGMQPASGSVQQHPMSYSLDDIDHAFAAIRTVKYSEELTIDVRVTKSTASDAQATKLVITPHPSGHSLGGTVWRITMDNSDMVLYAVSYHHSREKHVDSGVLEAFQRPALLIADAHTFGQGNVLKRKMREDSLYSLIEQTCLNAPQPGIVLLPTDSAARLLELLLVIYSHFELNSWFDRVPLILLSHTCMTLVEYARSQLEWMSESVQRFFDQQRNNPFEMKRLVLCRTFAQCIQATQNFTRPACILATSATLHTSFALQVLEAIHTSRAHRIILTQDATEASLAMRLRRLTANANANALNLPVLSYRKHVVVPLEGAELVEFNQKQLALKQQSDNFHNSRDARGDEASDSTMTNDDDSDDLGDEEMTAAPPQQQTSTQSIPSFVSNAFYVFPHHLYTHQALKLSSQEALSFGLPWTLPLDFAADNSSKSGAAAADTTAVSSISSHTTRVKSQLGIFPVASAHNSSNVRGPNQQLVRSDGSNNSAVGVSIAGIPCKLLATACSFTLACQISFVDMNGLSDERAWRAIVSGIKPRKLILVHGGMTEKEDFKHWVLEKKLMSIDSGSVAPTEASPTGASQIIVPSNLAMVALTSERLFRASINPLLLSKLSFTRINEFAVANLRASLRLINDTGRIQLPQLMQASSDDSSTSVGDSQKPHMVKRSSIFLGNVKFPADYRRLLANAGYDTEFYVKSGILSVGNGGIRIRKTSTTQISITGLLSADYYAVRALIYQAHVSLT